MLLYANIFVIPAKTGTFKKQHCYSCEGRNLLKVPLSFYGDPRVKHEDDKWIKHKDDKVNIIPANLKILYKFIF